MKKITTILFLLAIVFVNAQGAVIGTIDENGNLVKPLLSQTVSGTTDSGQGLSASVKTTLDTYDNSDITNGGVATAARKWNKHTTNDTIVLGDDITIYNQPWLESLNGADSLYIKKDTGATFYIADEADAITQDGVILKGGRKMATIIAESSNVFWIMGDVVTYNEALPYIYQGNNAADPNNEVDGVSGFIASVNSSISSSTEQKTDGSNSVKTIVTNAGSTHEIRIQTSGISIGDQIQVTMDVYRIATADDGGNLFPQLNSSNGWSNSVNGVIGSSAATTDVWVPITMTETATTSNPTITVFGTLAGTTPTYYIDNIVLTKTN